MKQPKQVAPDVLVFDIETIPDIVAAFSIRGKQKISHKQILKRSQVLCISWSWNDKKVQHANMNLDLYDWYAKDDNADFELVRDFVLMAQKAHVVVGHNARFFDVAKLRSRLVKYRNELGNLDFKPLLVDDTYLTTKGIGFESHKLDDISDYLGYEGKMSHGDGYEWWIDVMRGSRSRLKEMVKYCDIDVERTRTIYNDLRPFIEANQDKTVFFERPRSCPICNQDERPLIIRKYQTRDGIRYPVLQCPICNEYPFTKGNKVKGKPITEYNR